MYGALNSNLTAAIKTSFSMARDRLLPGSFARIGGREVPPAAVALTFVGAGFLVFLTIETIAILASLAFLGLFAFVHASVVALRRGERRSAPGFRVPLVDRKSTRLNSSHLVISYAVFCLKKKTIICTLSAARSVSVMLSHLWLLDASSPPQSRPFWLRTSQLTGRFRAPTDRTVSHRQHHAS